MLKITCKTLALLAATCGLPTVMADETTDRADCRTLFSFEALRVESEFARLDKTYGTVISLKFTVGRFMGDAAKASAARAAFDSELEDSVSEALSQRRSVPAEYRDRASKLASDDASVVPEACAVPAELKADSNAEIEAYETAWRAISANAGRFASERASAGETLAQR